MSTTITIPSQLVPHARDGAMYLLGLACDEIGVQTDLREPALDEALRRFDAMRSLLDVLPVEPATAAQIDRAHAPALREALTEATLGVAETARSEGHTALADEYSAKLPDLRTFTAALDREGDA